MKDLTEAYKEIYQLDEVKFANVGALASNVMRMPGGATPPKKDEPVAKDTPAPTPAAATTPAPSAMDQWAKANPKLAAAAAERARTRGTSETDNPLMKDMRANLPAPAKAQDPNFQSIMKSGKYGDQGYQSLTQNPNVRATAPVTSQNGKAAQPKVAASALQQVMAASQAAAASINNDPRAQAFDTSKYGFSGKTTPITPRKPLLRTPLRNSYDYGQMDSQQLTSLLNAYSEMYQDNIEPEGEQLDEFLGRAIDAAAAKVGPVIDRGVNAVFGKPKPRPISSSPTPATRPVAPTPAATAKPQPTQQQGNYGNVGSLGNFGGNLKYVVDRAKERNQMLNQSYQPEGEQLDEFLFGPSKVTPKGGQLSGSKAPVEVDKKYTAQKQGQLVNVQYDKGGNRKVTPMSPAERGAAALKLRLSGGGASSPSMNQYQTQSFEPEGEQIDEKCWDGYTKKGMKTMFGKRYPNCVKKKAVTSEEVEAYDIILDHILSEGLATSVENAEKIMSVMSDTWMQGILEDWRVGLKIPLGRSSSGLQGPIGVYGGYSTPIGSSGTQAAVNANLEYGDILKARTPETAVDQGLTNLQTGAPIPKSDVRKGFTGGLDAKISGSLGSGQQPAPKPVTKPAPKPKPEDPKPATATTPAAAPAPAPVPPPQDDGRRVGLPDDGRTTTFTPQGNDQERQVRGITNAANGTGDRQTGMGVIGPQSFVRNNPVMPGY